MSETLPEGWAGTTLGDLASYVTSGSRDWSKFYADRGALFIRTQDINQNRLASLAEIARVSLPKKVEGKRTLIKQGDLLITITGANVGKCAYVDQSLPEAYVSQSVALVRLLEGISGQFIHRQLISPSSEDRTLLQKSAYGVGRPVLNLDNVKEVPILYAPVDEQQRILTKVDELLLRVNSARSHLSHAATIIKRFRQAVLETACSGRLTFDGVLAEDQLPLGWDRCRLDSLFSVRTGGTPLRTVKEYFVDGSIPWVKTGELQNRDITSVEEHITPLAVEQSNAKVFPAGTILIAMYGEGKTRGQIGRLTFPAATNQACAALINPALLPETSEYVFTYLLSQYEKLRAEAVGGNQPNLNLSIIKQWEIPLPPPEQQREIVQLTKALLSAAGVVLDRVMEAKRQAEKLVQLILAKAFRGELVPTEAELARREGRDYEPASVLLERIKLETVRNGNTRSKRRHG